MITEMEMPAAATMKEQQLREALRMMTKMYEEQRALIHDYYHDELRLRGDQVLNREYRQYFKIEM